jgi:hypothetical protein
MSIIQSIIATAIGSSGGSTNFPVPGSNYPANEYTVDATGTTTLTGYWNSSSISNPVVGLWRRAYTGTALDGTNFDNNFPGLYTQRQSLLDPYVGFGSADDGETNYTMEWLGYFKPAVDGDFIFAQAVDDYAYFWIGQDAVSGFTNTNAFLDGSSGPPAKLTMLAGKYYPVRIRYTENQGGNEYALVSGLNNTLMRNNSNTAATGQFYTDGNTSSGSFPASGLIT